MNEKQFKKINGEYVRLAKRYNLSPALLKDIVFLNNQGYNHTQIASMTGVSRQTVTKYLNALRTMKQDDFWGIIVRIGLIGGGIYFGSKILEELIKSLRSSSMEEKGDK